MAGGGMYADRHLRPHIAVQEHALPVNNAFLPAVAGALCVADCVAATLLFAQFSIVRQWSLLGYCRRLSDFCPSASSGSGPKPNTSI
jgi:hypothetical protein